MFFVAHGRMLPSFAEQQIKNRQQKSHKKMKTANQVLLFSLSVCEGEMLSFFETALVGNLLTNTKKFHDP